MTIRKISLEIIAAALAAVVLTGCKGKGDNKGKSSETETSAQIVGETSSQVADSISAMPVSINPKDTAT
jgi:hypothetical protein